MPDFFFFWLFLLKKVYDFNENTGNPICSAIKFFINIDFSR